MLIKRFRNKHTDTIWSVKKLEVYSSHNGFRIKSELKLSEYTFTKILFPARPACQPFGRVKPKTKSVLVYTERKDAIKARAEMQIATIGITTDCFVSLLFKFFPSKSHSIPAYLVF
ncbi:MAG: hypothetical protein D8M57_09185 [Candidatus Scalindua sp. AMX11]|nr:MAG: hypothetical protein DWQ00_00585 [Candidatus Scalindua sp.]TDE65205.1 MAG: hypothetical protein D8M57_09185 [Candidatus Scalindua sp. AMX11]